MLTPFLYELHDAQRLLLAPFADTANAVAQLYSNPYSPLSYAPFSHEIAATCELAYRISKDYRKPEWELTTTKVDNREVAVLEEIVLALPFCHLIHFKRDTTRQDPVVLLVAPLSGHHATLLRDTVRSLLPAHDVYVTDWVNARDVPLEEGLFSLEDYVRYIETFLRQMPPGAHVISVCQPTVPVLAAVSLLAATGEPGQPRSMCMMGGPIDVRKSPTQVNLLATTKSYEWFEDNLIYEVPTRYPGAGRKVYPGFLQYAGFVAMHPDRHLKSHYDFYLHLLEGDEEDAEAHKRFYDEYNAVSDLPGRYYLDTVRIVFQEFRLPLGTWEIDGRRVDPSAIRDTALLTIEGERDDISGYGQTHAAHGLCSNIPASLHRSYTAAGCGHYGIFSGSRWRKLVYPEIAAFIRAAERLPLHA